MVSSKALGFERWPTQVAAKSKACFFVFCSDPAIGIDAEPLHLCALGTSLRSSNIARIDEPHGRVTYPWPERIAAASTVLVDMCEQWLIAREFLVPFDVEFREERLGRLLGDKGHFFGCRLSHRLKAQAMRAHDIHAIEHQGVQMRIEAQRTVAALHKRQHAHMGLTQR